MIKWANYRYYLRGCKPGLCFLSLGFLYCFSCDISWHCRATSIIASKRSEMRAKPCFRSKQGLHCSTAEGKEQTGTLGDNSSSRSEADAALRVLVRSTA